jgi:Mg2+/Co2+ transporter CorC
MPTNEYQWFFFGLYTIGSVGGLVYIATWIVDRLTSQREDEYDPWAEEDIKPTPSVPMAVPNPAARIEPPISARTK